MTPKFITDFTAKNCDCEFGTAATGKSCHYYGQSIRNNLCSNCDEAYLLNNNVCTCDFTKSVNDENDECKIKRCDCPNGSGAIGSSCPVNGEHGCESCNDDIFVVENSICVCDSLRAVVNSNGICISRNCKNNQHFNQNKFQCIDNHCICDNNGNLCANGNSCLPDDWIIDETDGNFGGELTGNYYNEDSDIAVIENDYIKLTKNAQSQNGRYMFPRVHINNSTRILATFDTWASIWQCWRGSVET